MKKIYLFRLAIVWYRFHVQNESLEEKRKHFWCNTYLGREEGWNRRSFKNCFFYFLSSVFYKILLIVFTFYFVFIKAFSSFSFFLFVFNIVEPISPICTNFLSIEVALVVFDFKLRVIKKAFKNIVCKNEATQTSMSIFSAV